jgi:hypothetical protein
MTNKIVKIPVSDINGLVSTGKYVLKYRVKSKDGSRVSDWSSPITVNFPKNEKGQTSSILELYSGLTAYTRALVSTAGADPHPSNGYAQPSTGYSASISKPEIDAGASAPYDTQYTCSWKIPTELQINKTYDIYVSWKDNTAVWSDWQFLGTTTSDSLTFDRLNTSVQYVQMAIFASSFPKYDNIFSQGETTFLAMTPVESVWQGANGTLGTVSTVAVDGLYTGIITITTASPAGDFPLGNKYIGRRIFADSGLGTGNGGVVRVAARTSAISIKVTSTQPLTAGTVTNMRF